MAQVDTQSLSYRPAGHRGTDPEGVLPGWGGSALVLWVLRPGEDPRGRIQEGSLEEEAFSWALKKEASEGRSGGKRVL